MIVRGCRSPRGAPVFPRTPNLDGARSLTPLSDSARRGLPAVLLVSLILLAGALPSGAKELRRSMSTLRPLLMGDAYVAVADESTVLFYNPAGLAWVHETSVEAFTPQFIFNEPVRIALVDPNKFQDELDKVSNDIDHEKYQTLLSREFFTDITIRSPIVIFPDKGLVLGLGEEALANLQVLGTRVVPLVRVEFFGDLVGVIGGFGKSGDYFSWGFNVKVINRRGVDHTYTAGDLAASAEEKDGIGARPEWKDVNDGVTFTRFGLDLGTVWRLPFAEEWNPRIGLSALNIGGYDPNEGVTGIRFGPRPDEFSAPQAGELPQINTIGFAVSPWWAGIRFTLAADIVDFTRTALPGADFVKRLHVGGEIGLYPHADGTARLGIMLGWNGGHTSYGFLSRVWIFEVGFGVYTVELGDQYGDNPDRRTTFLLGARF
jgi:hypothetical protein